MAVKTVDGWDATGANLASAPITGQPAGYITGSGGVQWSPAQQVARPGFVQIDQSLVITNTDMRADFYDLEAGAVTLAEIVQLVRDGQAAFKTGARPGQRWPGVYCSRNTVTTLVNTLTAANVQCPLGIADYNFDHAQAVDEVANASGPYPVVWRQYSDQGGGGTYDLDVFSLPWLQRRSTMPVTPQVPPGQWNPEKPWVWKGAILTVIGQDNLIHAYEYDLASGEWLRLDGPADVLP